MQQICRHRQFAPFVAGLYAFVFALILFIRPVASDTQKLYIITPYPETFARTIIAEFQRRTGIEVGLSFKATSTLVDHLIANEGRGADVVWMSSPVGIYELNSNGLLATDPDDCVFAYSRFGVMWRHDLLDKRSLAAPHAWTDLADPRYLNEVAMSAPSRSGTTAVFVEAVLQSEGWQRGWALLQELGGNLVTVTARSIGVREGLLQGRFAVGVGIDFLAKTTVDGPTPLRFLASPTGYLLPASVCALKNAENPEAAKALVAFLRSPPGQALLVDPLTQRVSLDEARHELAQQAGGFKTFDTELAGRRRGLVAVLFDQLITYRREDLNAFWTAYHQTNALALTLGDTLGASRKAAVLDRLSRARALAGAVAVADFMSAEPAFTEVFKAPPVPISDLRGLRARLQEEWGNDSRSRLREAAALVASAEELLSESRQSLATGQ